MHMLLSGSARTMLSVPTTASMRDLSASELTPTHDAARGTAPARAASRTASPALVLVPADEPAPSASALASLRTWLLPDGAAELLRDRARRSGERLVARVPASLRTHRAWLTITILAWLGALIPSLGWTFTPDGVTTAFDASVYYGAVSWWLHGGSLYDWYANWFTQQYPFTYPPFAAWVLSPLTVLGETGLQLVLNALTPLCTAVTAWAVLHHLGAPRRASLLAAPLISLVAVQVLEPFRESLYEGQVNAILMALVAVDLLVVPRGSRWRGVLSALAACFKLTPAIVLLVLLARREYRTVRTFILTGVAVTGAVAVISPRETWRFSTQALWDTSRAGFTEFAGNQSLKGALARFLPESWWNPAWALGVLLVVVGAWLLLRRLEAMRTSLPGRREEALLTVLELSVTMMTGLLVSPISWTHHWVWVVVALMAATAAALLWRSWSMAALAVAGAVILAIGYQWYLPFQNHVELAWPAWAKVVGSGYTWWALAAGPVLAVAARRRARVLAS